MIILKLSGGIIGFVFGVVLCNLIWEDTESEHSISGKKINLYYLISGIFMGCAFLCASHNFEAGHCIDSMFMLGGLIFLAAFAIQDILQLAVYAFLLNVGVIGMLLLRCTVFTFDGEFTKMFSFLIISGTVYVGLKIIAKVFPKFMGAGDYDILFLVFLLCGIEGTYQVLFASSLAGLLICIPLLLSKRIQKGEKIPLAPFFYLGTLAYLWM